MKAIEIRTPGGLDRLEFVDQADPPPPGPGQVTVRLRASSLNPHDIGAISGMPSINSFPPDGRIPLSDGAGEVVAVGPGVREHEVGSPVMAAFFPEWRDGRPSGSGFSRVPGDGIDGYAREVVTTYAGWFTRVPDGYSHAEAATLGCAGLTAWRALFVNGGLKPGQKVLVQGSGGVAIFALQFAKAVGATVIATSSSDAKIARLKDLGADHCVNYAANPEWGKEAFELSCGGADHVIEIGGLGTLNQSLAAIRHGGHIAMIGGVAGDGKFNIFQPIIKEARIQALTVGSVRHQFDMIAAIDNLGLRPVIDRHFPLAELAAAFRYQLSGAHMGKIVIDI